MNTTFSQPTAKALKNAEKVYRSAFTSEVFMNGFTPQNVRDHFGVSVQNIRGGRSIIVDYTFTKKTGKLVASETVDVKYLD